MAQTVRAPLADSDNLAMHACPSDQALRCMAIACSGLQYTVIFGYSYTNIHYCICICICISIYSIYNIQTAWRQVLSSFVKFTMHSRAPIPLYILGRFCSYMNIHYTPTLQNIHYTTYIPTLVPDHWSLHAYCTVWAVKTP